MKSSIKQFAGVLLVVFCAGLIANGQSIAPSKNLPNFFRINAGLYRGGQPTEEGIKQLKKSGVKTIIDLRGNDDRSKKEESWAHAAGLRYINMSLSNWRRPKDEAIAAIIRQIDRSDNQSVFVHCNHGSDRTGTVVAVYRITHDNWTGEQANAEAKKLGLGWWQVRMKGYINDYYKDFKAKTPKPDNR